MKFKEGEYPIFSGRGVIVRSLGERSDGKFETFLQFIQVSDELSVEEERKAILGSVLNFPDSKEALEAFNNQYTGAIVPLRLDPSTINGATVRTMFNEYDGQRFYELEILKGRPGSYMLEGLKYIKEL